MIYEEPLLWEIGDGQGVGFSIPGCETGKTILKSKHKRRGFKLPGLSEPEVSRHFTRLSTWNYGVDTNIYPLGSCTMKYNPKLNEKVASLKGFTNCHPLQGNDLSQGCLEVLFKTGELLKEITGMDDVTLQPAAGAHGELVSLMMFKKFHRDNGEEKIRDTILIPDSAHGTNPASASLCGFKIQVVKSNIDGVLTVEEVSKYLGSNIAGIMITNPNTLGIFEKNIRDISELVHKCGGLVYGDGANLNPLLGKVKVADTGVDAMHINLHKTFSTPHGGGGPGAGPVCVKRHLSKYLPNPKVVFNSGKYTFDYSCKESIGRVHGFYGNFSVILKAYTYILSMGRDGLKKVGEYSVLNANYIRFRLKNYYHLPYNADSMHEVLFNDENQKKFGVSTLDIAKRLEDKGFHPPTIYFPLVVTGSMLIEPTESESRTSLDNFIKAMVSISKEAKEDGNILVNSPKNCKCERVDETLAARKPILKGEF